jgi:hypothetical protein
VATSAFIACNENITSHGNAGSVDILEQDDAAPRKLADQYLQVGLIRVLVAEAEDKERKLQNASKSKRNRWFASSWRVTHEASASIRDTTFGIPRLNSRIRYSCVVDEHCPVCLGENDDGHWTQFPR